MIDKFGKYLSGEFSNDYWSEDAIYSAGDILDKISTEEWIELEGIFKSKNKQWQVRCLQSFAATDSLEFQPILRNILTSIDDDEILIECLDIIENLIDVGVDCRALLKIKEPSVIRLSEAGSGIASRVMRYLRE